jgi:NADH-quinone oxidoreductase subunit G
MDTVTLTINGRSITVEKGRTVLEAALAHGIDIPYYCYHPALGVDGSCRVCIVRIEKMPKLQTACSTLCTEGMVVDTSSHEVVAARASVFEFLLLNHPLDCPVCDKGGECPLQDYSYSFGPERSRMDFPRRVFDGEGVGADVDFGPTLMLNRNRCILCTRCVRFMREIDGDAQISIIDRGNGSQIATFEERGVHSLLSGNLMDVCPVGAITTRDYRFQSRPWDNLDAVDTICTRCPKGCNVVAWLRAKPEWAKGARLVRMTPRFNADVNGYWMCDIGRFEYHWVETGERLRQPLVRRGSDLLPVNWHDAPTRLREALLAGGGQAVSRTAFLVSAHASLEEMYLVQALARRIHGDAANTDVAVSWTASSKVQPARTKFRVPEANAPNARGAADLGLLGAPADRNGRADGTALRQAVEAGRVGALYVFDPGPGGSLGESEWVIDARQRGALPLLIVHGVLMSDVARAADIVLPGATSFEKEACYVNDAGLVQGAARVLAPPGDAMDDWQTLVNVAVSIGQPLSYTSAAQVRADIAAALAGTPSYARLTSVAFGQPVTVRHWLQSSNPSEREKWQALFKDLPPVKFADSAGGKSS